MADKIKKFFAKKKADAKFKLAGPGHRLTDSSTTVVGPSRPKASSVSQRSEPSDANRQAAQAALARLSGQKKDVPFNTSLAAIQAQVRRELEAEKKKASADSHASTKPVVTELEASPLLAVKGESLLFVVYWKITGNVGNCTVSHSLYYVYHSYNK